MQYRHMHDCPKVSRWVPSLNTNGIDWNAGAPKSLRALKTTPTLQIDKDRKGIVDHLMRAHTLQMCQRANTARIMLELRTIQPALRRHVPCLHSEPLTLTIEKPLSACPLRSTTFANRLPFPF